MRVGIDLAFAHADGRGCTAADVMADAAKAETAGFDGIWIGDTLARRKIQPDPFLWLGVAAAATRRVELGTCVVQAPLLAPVELAKRLLTLHALSGGRFTFGVGAGSTEGDFAAAGLDFTQRFQLLKESLAAMPGLCRGERVGEATLVPWADSGDGPPVVIGAWANGIWVKRAARHFQGWMGSGHRTDLQTLADGIARYRDAGGKRAMVSTVDIDITGQQPRPAREGKFSLFCDPSEAAERLQQIADLGYDDILLRTRNRSAENLAAVRALVPRSA